MPFTVSHAAVVLPFSRLLVRWRLLSAVVIGAMVPDFGLLLPWRPHRFETHSTIALFTFCLPVGLACYWLFQHLIKTPMLEVLPDGAYARWRRFASPASAASGLQWLLAACGVLVGAVSHLVWDAFTHEGARGVRLIPWLEDPIMEIGSHHVGGVRLLQDGSSLIGLVIVLALVLYGLRRGHGAAVPMRPLRPTERRAWALSYGVGAIALTVVWFLAARVGEPMVHAVSAHAITAHAITMLANGIAVASLRGAAMALVCVSLALDWRLRAIAVANARRPP